MTKAASELLDTIFNEISNNDHWTFDGQPIEGSSICEHLGEILITLPDYRALVVTVKEIVAAGARECPSCNKVKGGWPDDWANIAGKGLLYACKECVEAKANTSIVQKEQNG